MATNTLMRRIGGVRWRVEDARARGLLDDKNQLTSAGKEAEKAYQDAYDRRVRQSGGRRAGRVTNGRAVSSPAPEVQVPEGDPTARWTVPQLDAYAARHGVELSGDKDEKLRTLADHVAAQRPAASGDQS